ncbi:MAG: hypothetical protein AB2814_09390 [Candidatus Sedimenticola endophacoides]
MWGFCLGRFRPGALLLQGCESLGYYLQSAHGHFTLLGRSEPIERLLEAPATDVRVQECRYLR